MTTRPQVVLLALFALACLNVDRGFASTGAKRSRSDKDIAAIGHRNIAGANSLGNWYSLDREKEMGKQYSVEIERCLKVLNDGAMTDYVARVTDNIVRNSDAQMPITVRLVDSDKVEAFTLPGGYQYITRGLLLQLESEGELASVLARGIAHTALRSATRLMTRASWAKVGTVPLVFVGSGVPSSSTSGAAIPLTFLSFSRGFEFEADYFGVQYVYKAGYNTESFSRLVQRIWPASRASVNAFSPFPPTPDRLHALHKEIADLLPKRDKEIVSTPEFEKFKERLLNWKPAVQPVPTQTGEKPMPHEW